MAGEKILDIDDSPTVQRFIEMILSSQGYRVVLASDGEEGIAKARSERPAVILVDFVMPKLNGFQVCKTLKEDPSFSDTPIILVTSKGDKVGSKFVNVLGITEYLTKPFQPEELLAKIRAVIDNRKAAPVPARESVRASPREPAREPHGESRPELSPALRAPGTPSSTGGMEAMVRSIVEQALGEFVRETLPELIRKELARPRSAEGPGLCGSGARSTDEWGLIRQQIPRFDVVFEPVIGSAEELATRGMNAVDLRVFSYIDGRRTVKEIIDILDMGDFDVAKSVFTLLSSNLIRRR